MNIQKILLPILSLGTAALLTFGVLTPAFAQLKANADAQSNCAKVKIPKNQELEIDVDTETGFVHIGYHDEHGQQKETVLNFKEGENGFDGCTPDAKRVLAHVKEDVEKHDAEMCTDMREIAKGNRPLPERADIKPTLEDVKTYVDKKCKDK